VLQLGNQLLTFFRQFGALLASSQQGVQHALVWFSAVCD